MSELATWRARAADSDSAAAAEVWTDPSAPSEVLRRPHAVVLDYLLGDGCRQGTLSAVLRNPVLPNTVVAALAARAKGQARGTIARHALRDHQNVPRLIASAAAITPAELAKAVDGLRYGWEHHRIPDAAQATLVKILRAFTTSTPGDRQSRSVLVAAAISGMIRVRSAAIRSRVRVI